jgi:hypothetical protein
MDNLFWRDASAQMWPYELWSYHTAPRGCRRSGRQREDGVACSASARAPRSACASQRAGGSKPAVQEAIGKEMRKLSDESAHLLSTLDVLSMQST